MELEFAVADGSGGEGPDWQGSPGSYGEPVGYLCGRDARGPRLLAGEAEAAPELVGGRGAGGSPLAGGGVEDLKDDKDIKDINDIRAGVLNREGDDGAVLASLEGVDDDVLHGGQVGVEDLDHVVGYSMRKRRMG